jgi:glycerophosphoryl diester phosphodiesterase
MATPFAPENSLSALRAAILLGVDIVETDVRLTADGEIVILHDRSVDRTFEGSGDINTLTLAEAQSLTMHANPSLGGDFSCERLPTLAELMAIAAGRIVVELEVKESDAGVAAATYLRDNDLYASAFLLCDPSECAALRLAVPDAPIMTRPESANEVATETQYDPAPIMVHIDAYDDFLTDEVIDLIHGVGAKVYANAFLAADVEALSSGNLEPYLALYGGGLDVAQTELPHYALTALGRLSPTR